MRSIFFLFTIIVGVYCGFVYIKPLDAPVLITIDHFHIKSTLLSLSAIILLFLLCLLVVSRALSFAYNIPSVFKKLYRDKEAQKFHNVPWLIITNLITQNHQDALRIMTENQALISLNHQEEQNLILAEITEKVNDKIEYYLQLINSKRIQNYAYDKLSRLLYQVQRYQEAEFYAIKIYNISPQNLENLLLLLHCYFEMKLWKKMSFIVSKIDAIGDNSDPNIKRTISKYYLAAATQSLDLQHPLKLANNKQLLEYLKLSLEYDPSNAETLKYTENTSRLGF